MLRPRVSSFIKCNEDASQAQEDASSLLFRAKGLFPPIDRTMFSKTGSPHHSNLEVARRWKESEHVLKQPGSLRNMQRSEAWPGSRVRSQ